MLWCGMLRKAASASTTPKCTMIGVTKARSPLTRTRLASPASAITTKVSPVSPPAEEPTMT